MNKIITLIVALATTFSLSASVVTDTVFTGASYVNQVWYSLPNDEQGDSPKDNWDIAFQIPGFAASILANTQKGLQVFQSPYSIADWANVDTAGISGWVVRHNSEQTWDEGAFNTNPDDDFDLGWGTYDMNTHIVTGDSVFVIQLANGEWKKLKINQLANSTYTFTWADLDGSNEQNGSISKSGYAGKNFAYFSLENNTELDREPLSADWDLTFTKYMTTIYSPQPTPYGVTGLLLNSNALAIKAYPVDVNTVDFNDYVFQDAINTIGYDWKSFNNGTFQYDIADSTVYFVERANGDVWKLIFTGFGGSADGSYIFSKELVGSTFVGIEDVANIQALGIYPNPAHGQFNLICTSNETKNTVLRIFDLNGRMVAEETVFLQSGLNQQTISTANLQQGIYFLSLEGSKNIKLVVE